MENAVSEAVPTETVSFCSIAETCEITSLSRPTIWRLVRDGTFPRPVALTDRRNAFVRSEVNAWLRERIESRSAPVDA
ncbi:hypothetical protein B7H23_12885 [Notoacmeibacter marinus]|uniref:AlpA family phage regulatory protein n=1 Tax=Notoacmeibacter marinus TaxID=1876515 RepID=A0A231UT37_9HYPH|nr:AlpA family phage regulatory protein [Notoacmeibacter marinus]OXS99094.1 hypothetical protein B7H23_12885 [Notoacmeibacter marinus]